MNLLEVATQIVGRLYDALPPLTINGFSVRTPTIELIFGHVTEGTLADAEPDGSPDVLEYQRTALYLAKAYLAEITNE